MKNFSVKADGREYWISRSMATLTLVFKRKGDGLFVLVERRGKGAADYNGCICCPCGYLDFDETLAECAAREIQEETTLVINKGGLKVWGINDSPSENHQNVTVRFAYWCDGSETLKKCDGGEKDEVESVKWFKIGRFSKDGNSLFLDAYKIAEEDWAFGHDNLICDYLSKKFTIHYNEKD